MGSFSDETVSSSDDVGDSQSDREFARLSRNTLPSLYSNLGQSGPVQKGPPPPKPQYAARLRATDNNRPKAAMSEASEHRNAAVLPTVESGSSNDDALDDPLRSALTPWSLHYASGDDGGDDNALPESMAKKRRGEMLMRRSYQIPPLDPIDEASAHLQKAEDANRAETMARAALKLHRRLWHAFRLYVVGELHRQIVALAESSGFSGFIFVVIILNTISLAITTIPESAARYEYYLDRLEAVFFAIYVFEAALKICAFGIDYFHNGWNLLDFLVLIGNTIDFTAKVVANEIPSLDVASIFRLLRVLRVFRALRALRVLRTIRFFKNLHAIVQTCLKSLESVGMIFLFMVMLLIMFAVMGRELYATSGPGGRKYFGSILTSLATLFQILTLDDWFLVYLEIRESGGGWHFFFFTLVYILLEYFICLNLFIAVLVDNFQITMKHMRHTHEEEHGELEEEDDDGMVDDDDILEASMDEWRASPMDRSPSRSDVRSGDGASLGADAMAGEAEFLAHDAKPLATNGSATTTTTTPIIGGATLANDDATTATDNNGKSPNNNALRRRRGGGGASSAPETDTSDTAPAESADNIRRSTIIPPDNNGNALVTDPYSSDELDDIDGGTSDSESDLEHKIFWPKGEDYEYRSPLLDFGALPRQQWQRHYAEFFRLLASLDYFGYMEDMHHIMIERLWERAVARKSFDSNNGEDSAAIQRELESVLYRTRREDYYNDIELQRAADESRRMAAHSQRRRCCAATSRRRSRYQSGSREQSTTSDVILGNVEDNEDDSSELPRKSARPSPPKTPKKRLKKGERNS